MKNKIERYFIDREEDYNPKEFKEGTLDPLIAERLDNIKDVEEDLQDDRRYIWKLPKLVKLAKQELRIKPKSGLDTLITHTFKEHNESSTGSIALSLVLAIISILGSGGLAVIAGAASILLGGSEVHDKYQDYSFRKAAAGTSFNKANSIAEDEPDLIWLAIEIGLLITDLSEAKDVFKAIKTIVKDSLKRGAKNVDGLGKQLNKIVDDPEIAGKLTSNIEDSFKKHKDWKKKFGDNYDTVLKTEAKIGQGATDEACTGFIKIQRQNANAFESLLENIDDPAILARIGERCSKSDELVKTIDTLYNEFSIKTIGDITAFDIIVKGYMGFKSTKGFIETGENFIILIKKMGLTNIELNTLAKTMKSARTSGGVLKKFRQGIRQYAVEKSGQGEGIRKIRGWTKGLESKEIGNFFEDWLSAYINRYKGMKGKTIVYNFNGKNKTAIADGVIEEKKLIVEAKNILSVPPRLGNEALERLEKYKKILKTKPEYDHVDIVFSTYDAAKKNFSAVQGILKKKFTVKYIDNSGNLKNYYGG